jgi:hypothetical protein
VGRCLSQKNVGATFELVMTAWAERDEISQVEGCATGRYRLDVVNLEPTVRAALGTAPTIPAEYRGARSLPFRRGADEDSGFIRCATLP